MDDLQREPDPVDGEAVTDLAEELLRRRDPSTKLTLIEPIVDHPGYRHAVFRCGLEAAGRSRTVVVKRANGSSATAAREAAALRLLAGFDATRMLVPELLAHAPERGLLVLEDLGHGPRVREVLLADDPALARSALLGWMAGLASIHGATHQDALAGLPAGLRTEPRSASLDVLRKRLVDVGVSVSTPFEQELERVQERLHTPGWSTALTLQDVAPSNAILHRDSVRLYDLEFAGYRSALVDGTYPDVRLFRANDTGTLPDSLRDALRETYRRTLAQRLPAAADDELYQRARADAVLLWTASSLARLPQWLERDRQRFRATERRRILATVTAWTHDDAVRTLLPRAATAMDRLLPLLRDRWELETPPLPPFPAFAEPSQES